MHGQGEAAAAVHLEVGLAASGIIGSLGKPYRLALHQCLVGRFGDDIHIQAVFPGFIHVNGDVFQGRHSAAPAAGPVPSGGEFSVGPYVIFPAQAVFGPGGHQGIVGSLFQFPGIFSVSADAQHFPGEMHPFHHRTGFGTFIRGPLGRAVEQLPAIVYAAPGAAQGGQVGAADAFPGIGAGFQQTLVPEQPVGLGHSREAAVHLIDFPVADQGYVVALPGKADQLEAGRIVQLEDAAVDEFLHHRDRPQEIEVAEGIQDAASGHAAVLPRLGNLDALFKDRPMQEFGNVEGTVGISGLVQGDAGLGEAFHEVRHDPGVPVHLHFFGTGPMVVAFVFPVTAQVAILFLAGDQVVGYGDQFFLQHGVSGALISLCGGVHPLAGVLPLPSAFSLRHHFRAEKTDRITVRTRDILRKASVVACVDGVAQKAADGDCQKQ